MITLPDGDLDLGGNQAVGRQLDVRQDGSLADRSEKEVEDHSSIAFDHLRVDEIEEPLV